MDYKNGKIYKLINDELGLTYYGSTTTTLTKRLCGHKSKSNKCKSKLLFTEGAVEIFLVEEFPCENKDQLNQRERFYIENNACVNKKIPGRTLKEYREANKEAIKEQSKEYREANKEAIKEYYEANKEVIKEQHKEYQKEYREANKETLAEKHKEKFDCECGGKFTLSNRSRHLNSPKHIKYSGGLTSTENLF